MNRIPLYFNLFFSSPFLSLQIFPIPLKAPDLSGVLYSPLPFPGISGSSRLRAGVTGPGAALSAPDVNPRLSSLGCPYIHTNWREKMWSSVVARLPQPHYGSSIETSAILWARQNLSLPALYFPAGLWKPGFLPAFGVRSWGAQHLHTSAGTLSMGRSGRGEILTPLPSRQVLVLPLAPDKVTRCYRWSRGWPRLPCSFCTLCLHHFMPKAPDGVCTIVYCIYSVSGAQGCLSPYEHQSSLSN